MPINLCLKLSKKRTRGTVAKPSNTFTKHKERKSMKHGAIVLNLAMIIETHAHQTPDKIAIVFGDTRLTYKQLNDCANQIANGLKSLGIGPGDNVALSSLNLPYFP